MDLYVPFRQTSDDVRHFVVKTTANPLSLATTINSDIVSVDRQLSMVGIGTMEQVVGRARGPWRFNMLVFSAFGVVALILAAAGLFALVGYEVNLRSREIAFSHGAWRHASRRGTSDDCTGYGARCNRSGHGASGGRGNDTPPVEHSVRRHADRSGHVCRGRVRATGSSCWRATSLPVAPPPLILRQDQGRLVTSKAHLEGGGADRRWRRGRDTDVPKGAAAIELEDVVCGGQSREARRGWGRETFHVRR